MRKSLFLLIVFLMICPILLSQRYRNLGNFILPNSNGTHSVDVAAGSNATNGTEFDSREISVAEPDHGSIAFFMVEFTRSAGSTATVDFEFEASPDDGVTWTTAAYVTIEVATNSRALNNEVRIGRFLRVAGISKIRLVRIVNNDNSNNLEDCDVSLSIRIER